VAVKEARRTVFASIINFINEEFKVFLHLVLNLCSSTLTDLSSKFHLFNVYLNPLFPAETLNGGSIVHRGKTGETVILAQAGKY
jgi:hypothetical protein